MKSLPNKLSALAAGIFLLAFATPSPAAPLSGLKTFGTAGKQLTLLTTGREAELFHYAGRGCLTHLLDPQANATSGVGLDKISGASAYQVLLGDGGLLDKIKPTAFDRLEIIPSEMDLCAADLELARLENHLHRVAPSLQPVRDCGRFDLVLWIARRPWASCR